MDLFEENLLFGQGRPQCGLDLFSYRNVAGDLGHPDDVPNGIANGRLRQGHVDACSVLTSTTCPAAFTMTMASGAASKSWANSRWLARCDASARCRASSSVCSA